MGRSHDLTHLFLTAASEKLALDGRQDAIDLTREHPLRLSRPSGSYSCASVVWADPEQQQQHTRTINNSSRLIRSASLHNPSKTICAVATTHKWKQRIGRMISRSYFAAPASHPIQALASYSFWGALVRKKRCVMVVSVCACYASLSALSCLGPLLCMPW